MGQQTNIQWADDTHNFWRGCSRVSEGCRNCYAETLVENRMAKMHYDLAMSGSKLSSVHFYKEIGKPSFPLWGKGAPRIRSVDFAAPLRWNKKPLVCDRCGEMFALPHSSYSQVCESCNSTAFHRRRVFSLSLGDWLDEEVPIEWLADMLDVIRQCPNLDFLLLTKRPENFKFRLQFANGHCAKIGDLMKYEQDQYMQTAFWIADWLEAKPPANIWLGTSVENQKTAEERIAQLLLIPARVRFLSVEPLLGPIDLIKASAGIVLGGKNMIHWAIFGGESGPGARPCRLEWIRNGLKQCAMAGIAPFVKQLGSCAASDYETVGKIKDKKGGDMNEWPNDLRVRQFPQQ